MCGVIVVDAGRSRSTCHGRDAYIQDHSLVYRHNYALFYQLLNSNLSTHRIFSFNREASSEYGPWIYFPSNIFRSINQKNPKIPRCNLLRFTLFCSFIYLLYLCLLDLTLVRDREGVDNPFFAFCASVC